MLQSAHFEQDFKGGPKVLLRGDAKGMCGLRDFLRQLRTVGAPLTLTGLCEAADAKKDHSRACDGPKRERDVRPKGSAGVEARPDSGGGIC